ncbi:peptidylprolyl isomerase [Leptothoe sp. ISB3NOV94-8A]|uniref:peptidylprolyl isomerase n=1 Tax=Adonisia turfae CCMR0081 TaxID=2292702 RepID=A0A6M0RFP8_9CYAN|nr:peptidylprolyl isomerase [Adonisia turfae]MDV3353701.1 peptidylprolyl isomerase [Leptothoe sp. LEGE 181152]NEZ55077.1 peptidylprolyl isomerase [Adonisia turfae CCMR0081]
MARFQYSFQAALAGLLGVGFSFFLSMGWFLVPSAQAGPIPSVALPVAYLPPGDAITDPNALLRYALPIDSPEIRKVQDKLEGLNYALRTKQWGRAKRDIYQSSKLIHRKRAAIVEAIPEERRSMADPLLEKMDSQLEVMEKAVKTKDLETLWASRRVTLNTIGDLEYLMVKGFPYEVPTEYDNLPQLKGRATIEFKTNEGPVIVVVDGYSAPITAGNFVDLVKRGFYDGMTFDRAEENYVLQTGDPDGPEAGFIDPKTQKYRAIPLEILVEGDEKPTYGATLEELGRFLEKPVLPFNSFGALAMARPESEPDGGSSQFFFFLFEPELTPAGLNLLDGRYAVFGYTIEGQDALDHMGRQGGKIISAKVVNGLDNLVEPKV